MPPIDVDVLVIGGGAQGLWLLNDLDKHGYRTILLERDELGGGQTCHSHALIHRGHYYDDTDMMIVLNASAQFWEAFVEARGVSKLVGDGPFAGFGPGTGVQLHEYFWRSAGLRFERCHDLPSFFQGGDVRELFRTEEFSLDATEVVGALAAGVDHCIYQVDGDDPVELAAHDGRVHAVRANVGGNVEEIVPQFVVLAAGVGNLELLRQIGSDLNGGSEVPVQAQRKNQMLVLRGDALPSITAVFPTRGGLQGVFICSRSIPNSGQTVWLVSDHNSVPFQMHGGGQGDAAPLTEWVKRILTSLHAITPALFSDESTKTMDASLYTGLTSERSFGAGQHMSDCFIDPLRLTNVLTIWPTKLTLTPFASNVAVRAVRAAVPEPSGVWPRIDRPLTSDAPGVAVEMWRRDPFEADTAVRTEWRAYAEFVDQWSS